MQIPLTKIFLVLMFVFTLFSNVLNYVAIATTEWLTIVRPTATNNNLFETKQYGIWDFNLTNISIALIATGTALNILGLIFAFLSVLSICVEKIRLRFAVVFVFICMVVVLFALLFNAVGWYFYNVTLQEKLMPVTKLTFGWSYWLMTPSFGCDVLAAVFASCIVGCSFSFNQFERNQRTRELETQEQQQQQQYDLPQFNPTFTGDVYTAPSEKRPSTIQASFELNQTEQQRVLRL